MASVSVSHLVIFIAALTVSVGVASTLTVNVQDMSVSIDERSDSVAEDIETDVAVISDPGSPQAIYDDSDGEVTLLVKNTGNRPIYTDASEIDVLIDGRYAVEPNVTVVGDPGSTTWRQGGVVRVTVPRSLDSGEHRAAVRVRSAEDTLLFHVS